VQVHPKIGFDFPEAVRSIVRADPDVILIGDVRDRETAVSGLDAALAGHLVLAAMRTRGAPEALGRLIDWQIDRHGLAGALVGVLAQRLVRGLCRSCRVSHPATSEERALIREAVGEATMEAAGWTAPALWQAPGCRACGGSGEEGRVAVHEMLVPGEELRQALIAGDPPEELRQIAVAGGMVPLVADGITKAVAGHVDLTQVVGACSR
jgi:type II secretory ATPase GspE/PulE/Tfp pilus assembly ATPase PilB-like protein